MADWPIFVLTLPGDDDRRAPLMAQLAEAGLRAELVFGVDGRRGLPTCCETQIDRAAARTSLGREMTDGEFACALSHRAIYQTILDANLGGAIILEDDAILLPGFADLVRETRLGSLPLVLIDYAYGRAIRFSRRRLDTVTLHRVAFSCTMANAYFINRMGAVGLLRAATPVSHPADWPCCLHGLGAWMVSQRLAFHAPPGQGRISHLDAARENVEAARTCPAVATKQPGIAGWMRRKLSIRLGRERGQR